MTATKTVVAKGSQKVELSIFLIVAKELTLQLYGWDWLVASRWLILLSMAEQINHEAPEQELQTKETLIRDLRKPEAESLPPEVERWMKLRREEIPQQKQVQSMQPVLKQAAPTNPKIVLPVTRLTFKMGFKKAVGDAGRWLSVFLFRVIKIKKGDVEFKDDNV